MSESEKVSEETKIEQQIQTSEKKEDDIPPFVKSESNKENWKAFKEARENERKRAEVAEKNAAEDRARAEAMREAMEALINKPNHQQYSSTQYGQSEETEDERIQKKVDAALTKERQKYQEQERKREAEELPSKLTQAFPDFNRVCHPNNIDYLEFHYPEVAEGIRHMPEGFNRWATIYKAINKFVPSTDIKKDQQKLAQNMQKPQSLSSSSTLEGTQSKGPIIMDEARRAANWERMQKQMKGLS